MPYGNRRPSTHRNAAREMFRCTLYRNTVYISPSRRESSRSVGKDFVLQNHGRTPEL
jgi:hypothetical protein